MDERYQMIFKRKSFHVWKGTSQLTEAELSLLQQELKQLHPLVPNLKFAFRVVPKTETTCNRGEYCILFYSERKKYDLYQAGYLLEQLDLWLADHDIGSCFYGVGEPNQKTWNGLDFIIMMAIQKVDHKEFRKDYTKAKRKPVTEFWEGPDLSIAPVVRYAPSACNTQPWKVKVKGKQVFVSRILGKRGSMPYNKVCYYNKIDLGIFLLFLELNFQHQTISFHRQLIDDDEKEETLVAIYDMDWKGEHMTKKAIPFPLENLHTTPLGVDRIRTNLTLGPVDVVDWCKEMIMDPKSSIVRKGKNWYITVDEIELTVNASSMTIITAHKRKNK